MDVFGFILIKLKHHQRPQDKEDDDDEEDDDDDENPHARVPLESIVPVLAAPWL